MTKILSMFFTGLTLLSFFAGELVKADCYSDLTNGYSKDARAYRDASFGQAFANGGKKEFVDTAVKVQVLPEQFVKEFCASPLKNRTSDLSDCFFDAVDAKLPSETQPETQQACVAVLLKYPTYLAFNKCFESVSKKVRDPYDAFYACLEK